MKFVHHLTLEVWKLSVLWYSPQILSAAYDQRQKMQFLWLKSMRSEHWLRGENAKIFPLMPTFHREKKTCPLYSVSPGLKSQLYWKRHFLSFRTFEQPLIHLQSLAEVKGGEGGTASPQGVLGTPTEGKVPLCECGLKPTQVTSLLLFIWAFTILFNGTVWNFLPGPVQMLKDDTNNLL